MATRLLQTDFRPINHLFINIAPAPVFTRLERLDDRMFRRMEVFRGVLVLRRIAAADVAAGHAEPQVDPRVANLQAVFTAVSARRDFANLIKMSAGHFAENLRNHLILRASRTNVLSPES